MKRILTTMALLAALTGSASAYSYILPGQQPGAYTDNDWQPVYSIEGLYNIAQDSDLPDTWGVRGSINLYSGDTGDAFTHQFSINLAANWGSDDAPLARFAPEVIDQYQLAPGQRVDVDLFLLPVTFGYDLNIALSDNVTLFLGAKAGYAWSHGKVSGTVLGERYSESESEGGFTYSVGGGLKVQCTDAINIHAGYEFGRSYLDYDFNNRNHLIYGAHTVYFGVGGRF